ncbi:hypothetical protein V1511DRAFT_486207 [Dipodascopsis uninucleata]
MNPETAIRPEVHQNVDKNSHEQQRAVIMSLPPESDWTVPDPLKVSISCVPEILVSVFGMIKPGVFLRDEKLLMMDSSEILEPRLFYTTLTCESPFMVFAAKWAPREHSPPLTSSTSLPTGHEQPTAGHEQPTGATAPQKSHSIDEGPAPHSGGKGHALSHEVAAVKHSLLKASHGGLPSSMSHRHDSSDTDDKGDPHPRLPTSEEFSRLLSLPKEVTLQSVNDIEWDPAGSYKHIMVDMEAATGSPIRVFKGVSSVGIDYYWVVATMSIDPDQSVAPESIVVGVTTATSFFKLG